MTYIYIFQAKKAYKIIKFIGKNKKKDIAIISAKWLSIRESAVYTPPPNFPTLELAREHTTPSPSWRLYDDEIEVLFTYGM